jgi:hypothetical protein
MSTADEIKDAREEEQVREAAIGQASQSIGMDQARVPTPDTFIDQMGAPGISATEDAGQLEQKLAAELSHHHVFSNIDRETWEGLKINNAALAMRVKSEHPPKSGPGSKCRGQYRREMFGEDAVTLTDARAREIDSALGEEGVRTMMQAKSIDGMAFKGATRVESVVHTDRGGSDDSGSLLGGLKDALGFGGSD